MHVVCLPEIIPIMLASSIYNDDFFLSYYLLPSFVSNPRDCKVETIVKRFIEYWSVLECLKYIIWFDVKSLHFNWIYLLQIPYSVLIMIFNNDQCLKLKYELSQQILLATIDGVNFSKTN